MAEMRVYLVEHDAAWAGMFDAERRLLEGLLGPWRQGSIEHVGSTAVAGLCAKPVVDVMVGIRSLADTLALKQVLGQAGYQYSDWRADEEVWFCKPSFEHRTHHVHLVPHESPRWRDTVRFRDALRRDPELAEAYATLKRQLAQQFEFDRDAYTEAKWPFIAQALCNPVLAAPRG